MGRIAMLTSRVSPGKTPIAKEITHFIWIISVIAFIIGGVFFVGWFSAADFFLYALLLKMWTFFLFALFPKIWNFGVKWSWIKIKLSGGNFLRPQFSQIEWTFSRWSIPKFCSLSHVCVAKPNISSVTTFAATSYKTSSTLLKAKWMFWKPPQARAQ